MVTEKQQLVWMDELRKESSRYCKQMGIDRKIDSVFFKEQFIKKVNHKLSHFSPWRKHEYEAMKRT